MAQVMRVSPILPWDRVPEEEHRFRRLLAIIMAVVAVVGVIIMLIKLPPPPRIIRPDVPERLVKLVVEKKQLPPPPPVELPKPEEKKPEEKKPEPEKPKEQPKPEKPVKTAKEVAKQHMAVFDALADLRSEPAPAASPGKPLTDSSAGGAPSLTSARALISDRAKAGSGGIVTAKASSDRGSGGGLAGTSTSQVVSNIASESAVAAKAKADKGGGAGSKRSDESIQRGFDDAKASIFALYNRALRSNPDLKGKVIFRLEIQPDGTVTNAAIVSSELNDPELERKLLAKVRQINFGPAGAIWKDTYRMDFFPT